MRSFDKILADLRAERVNLSTCLGYVRASETKLTMLINEAAEFRPHRGDRPIVAEAVAPEPVRLAKSPREHRGFAAKVFAFLEAQRRTISHGEMFALFFPDHEGDRSDPSSLLNNTLHRIARTHPDLITKLARGVYRVTGPKAPAPTATPIASAPTQAAK